jgi:hypothetical protein
MVGDEVLGLGREDPWTLLRAREGAVASFALLDELLLHPAVVCQIFGSGQLQILCLAVIADKGCTFLLPGTSIRSITVAYRTQVSQLTLYFHY